VNYDVGVALSRWSFRPDSSGSLEYDEAVRSTLTSRHRTFVAAKQYAAAPAWYSELSNGN
jgi:hypothetical protein